MKERRGFEFGELNEEREEEDEELKEEEEDLSEKFEFLFMKLRANLNRWASVVFFIR